MTALTLFLIRAVVGPTPPTVFEMLQAASSVLGFPAIIVALLLFLLNRKGANKKLSLDERNTNVTEFDAKLKAYQDLLDRSNEAGAEALLSVIELKERVNALEEADTAKSHEIDSANKKIELLRKQFTSYIERTGVPLTPEEQEIFDMTVPSPRLRRSP